MLPIYELKLTKQGMDIILGALAELPYKVSGALIDACMKQWTAQEEAAVEKAKAEVLAQDAQEKLDVELEKRKTA